jgi:shikimate dehydrogenase
VARFVLIGDPVGHSKSPAMHGAAHRACGMSHTYEAVRVREDELASAVARLRSGELAGINVTVPHKRAVLDLADEVDAVARRCEAANVLVLREGRVIAFNTDVPALVAELDDGAGAGGKAVVLGNGGAARAAKIALETLGATPVVVRARRGGDEPLVASGTERDARWIVQATSAGMTGAAPGDEVARAVQFELARHALALDVVYEPRETPFLVAARLAGLRTKNGLGMLARQGALAFELWLGVTAPLEVMRDALG